MLSHPRAERHGKHQHVRGLWRSLDQPLEQLEIVFELTMLDFQTQLNDWIEQRRNGGKGLVLAPSKREQRLADPKRLLGAQAKIVDLVLQGALFGKQRHKRFAREGGLHGGQNTGAPAARL